MGYLKEKGVITKDNDTADIFEQLIPHPEALWAQQASQYITTCWDIYQKSSYHHDKSQSRNGRIFEYILATTLYLSKLCPFALQAKFTLIPNIIYDILLYTNDFEQPIILSAKTSLRERYKQADLEALALKNVYRKAQVHLITLDSKEAKALALKIQRRQVLRLDSVVDAQSKDFDALIAELQRYTYTTPPTIRTATAQNIVEY